MIEPHQEVAISLTKAEWLQIVFPSIGKQPYEAVAGVMQKMCGQMQMLEMQNGHDRVAASTNHQVADGFAEPR